MLQAGEAGPQKGQKGSLDQGKEPVDCLLEPAGHPGKTRQAPHMPSMLLLLLFPPLSQQKTPAHEEQLAAQHVPPLHSCHLTPWTLRSPPAVPAMALEGLWGRPETKDKPTQGTHCVADLVPGKQRVALQREAKGCQVGGGA